MSIAGLGPTKAKDILASRADFSCIEDLKKVKGVGPGVFRNISGFLYLSSAKRVLDRIPHIHPDHIKDLEKIQKKFGEKLDRLEDGDWTEVFLRSLTHSFSDFSTCHLFFCISGNSMGI